MKDFGQLEAAVMDAVWAAGGTVTVRQILDRLQPDRTLAYTTIMTVMDNLHRKGWLVRELDGRAYHYQAVHQREEYGAQLMREALDVGGDRKATMLHFLDTIDPDDLDQLRAALRRRGRTPKS
ncbi:BlaI/MecI/CopY family transcriptional regulator [Longispora sp. K20-0274]|uniref:BlaI/MecI/CopY family transcriptional regulator n=1 Tax=Longispora sp. K20-0274 TaxID=3088255 RepID=UPI00399AF7DE